MIKVQGLTKRYGEVVAINDVSFEVNKGEIMGFLGPNGAGKTTTMRILTCFMPATRGTATVGGKDVFKDSIEVRKRIGYLPESAPLYLDMPVKSYLQFVAEAKGVPRGERTKQIGESIEAAGLKEVEKRMVGHLSKGYRQRVGLAQALVSNPEVLILDEPTVGLDPRQIQDIRDLIRNMRGERTIILCSHILPEVSMLCERVTIINRGKIIAQDTPENLTKQVQKVAQTRVQVDGPAQEVKAALQAIPGVTKVTLQAGEDGATRPLFLIESDLGSDIRPDIAKTVVGKNWRLFDLTLREMSLEEIFIQLVSR